MKLWDKGYSTEEIIESFTVGKDRELDLFLAPFDVLGTLAHIQMLESIDLLKKEELAILSKELKSIYREIEKGNFQIEDGVEDVHSQVEMMLTKKLGEVGKKVHSGRSRNDQVLLDLKLYFRAAIEEVSALTKKLFQSLQRQSEVYKDVLLPGYTHLQVAMPSSFGLWFGSYAEALIDDIYMLEAAWKVVNQNPLGSAAGYGSSFPLNRSLTTELLGFETLAYNVVYAQMGRGKTEKLLAYAIASLGSTLSKLSMDVCLYMSQNFGFLGLPKELTTGSSIMPHKKNPDVFEMLRAKGNKLQALPFEISHITGNLPSGYHRDLQLTKESLIPAIEDTKTCLEIAAYMVERLEVKSDILNHRIYDYLFSVEVVNREVLKGKPFREAYRIIGEAIDNGNFRPEKEINHTHEGSIGNLCTEEIKAKMDTAFRALGFEGVKTKLASLLE
ncbi:MAG: argininosuccinate lyase [Bacteroidota bacterium]